MKTDLHCDSPSIASRVAIRLLLTLSALAMLIGCSGCSGRPAGLVDVSGVVTLDDQPLSAALVRLQCVDDADRIYIARTGDDGTFTLMQGRETGGAFIGKYDVKISTYVEGNPEADPPLPEIPEKLPERYWGDDSELSADIVDGKNTLTFPLKSQ